ncbi:MAG: fructose-bisphosphate aldolase [Candidatus Pacebacteria bacterium]|nr:fructose-bisphosphate aldolase [Candidatus Paceibacterota bacterium]
MDNNLLQPFLKNNKALFLAYDHGIELGHEALTGQSIDPEYILDLAVKGGYTGIILQKGIAEKYYYGAGYQRKTPLILKINGKTNVSQNKDPYPSLNCSVEYAKRLGAQAVGYTIYLGGSYEPMMISEFGQIQEKAHQLNMAVIAWVYLRGPSIEEENNPQLTMYASRVGLELGADMIKIKYPGSEESLRKAVQAAGKTKVLLAGGPKSDEEKFLETMETVMRAGASGVAVGRNVFQNQDPFLMTEKIKKIIFSG